MTTTSRRMAATTAAVAAAAAIAVGGGTASAIPGGPAGSASGIVKGKTVEITFRNPTAVTVDCAGFVFDTGRFHWLSNMATQYNKYMKAVQTGDTAAQDRAYNKYIRAAYSAGNSRADTSAVILTPGQSKVETVTPTGTASKTYSVVVACRDAGTSVADAKAFIVRTPGV